MKRCRVLPILSLLAACAADSGMDDELAQRSEGASGAASSEINSEDELVDKAMQSCWTEYWFGNAVTVCDPNYRVPDEWIMVKEDLNYGSWTRWFAEAQYVNGVGFEMCPHGSFVYSYEIKHAHYAGTGHSPGSDDTGLNGIKLNCWAKNGGANHGSVTSGQSPWGLWTGTAKPEGADYNLGNPMTGMEMKWLGPQGSNDDVGAVRVRAKFRNGAVVTAPFYANADWGNWQGMQSCPSNMAVCGIDTQIYPNAGSGDDLGMTGVRLACCWF